MNVLEEEKVKGNMKVSKERDGEKIMEIEKRE